MYHYFVKYSLNGASQLSQFTTAIDAEPGLTANDSADAIIHKIVKQHNSRVREETSTVHNYLVNYYDIVILVLTRLN